MQGRFLKKIARRGERVYNRGTRTTGKEAASMLSEVPGAVLAAAASILGAIVFLVIWATNKGYSKRWDEE